MKSTALVSQPRFGSAAGASLFALALLIISHIGVVHAQNEPILVPDAVDYQKLLPILPDPPQGWVADKAEGSTEDVGGFRITNVHRDYHKGESDKAPTAAISVLDSVANPDYVNATTAAWNNNSETTRIMREKQSSERKRGNFVSKHTDFKRLCAGRVGTEKPNNCINNRPGFSALNQVQRRTFLLQVGGARWNWPLTPQFSEPQ